MHSRNDRHRERAPTPNDVLRSIGYGVCARFMVALRVTFHSIHIQPRAKLLPFAERTRAREFGSAISRSIAATRASTYPHPAHSTWLPAQGGPRLRHRTSRRSLGSANQHLRVSSHNMGNGQAATLKFRLIKHHRPCHSLQSIMINIAIRFELLRDRPQSEGEIRM